jgi:type IV secretion system protein VirD4
MPGNVRRPTIGELTSVICPGGVSSCTYSWHGHRTLMATPRSQPDVRPVTWELPVAGVACWLRLVLMLLPAGQGVACYLFSGGFVWPRGSTPLMHSVGGLMTGQPGEGLAGTDRVHLAPTPLIYILIVLAELLLAGATAWAIVLWWRHLGPGARRGMADRAEVEAVLGVSNLRKKAAVIRPDLSARTARNAQAART